MRPSPCHLCRSDLEDLEHVFNKCPYADTIWNSMEALTHNNLQAKDIKETILKEWHLSTSSLPPLFSPPSLPQHSLAPSHPYLINLDASPFISCKLNFNGKCKGNQGNVGFSRTLWGPSEWNTISLAAWVIPIITRWSLNSWDWSSDIPGSLFNQSHNLRWFSTCHNYGHQNYPWIGTMQGLKQSTLWKAIYKT